MLEERPQAVAERAGHRHALVGELGHAERGIAVHLLDDFLEIAERELPHRILQGAERLAAEIFKAFVHRLARVAHRAFAEQLRLAEIRIPAGALDPASHHVALARHQIDVVRRLSGNQAEDLVAHLRRAALVRIEAENPFVRAGLERAVAQVAEALEFDLHHARTALQGNVRGAVAAVRVDQHDFIGPAHAVDGGGDLLFLVKGKDIGGYLGHGRMIASWARQGQ